MLGTPIQVLHTNTAEAHGWAKAFAVLTKLGRAEHAIIRVVALNGDTNICQIRFQKQFVESVTGSSGQLVVDEKDGAAMINIMVPQV